MSQLACPIGRTLLVLCLLASAPIAAQQPAAPRPASDLDAFMEKVLARREVNRKTLDQYVLDETEGFEILGPGRHPLHRSKREFTWYVRDGMHVRSPVKFNGVPIGEEARNRYEENWIRREKGRQERKATQEKERREVTISPGGLDVSTGAVPTEPRFVSEAYFMDFKFEPGNYFLAGREQLEGKDVLRIEYYPTRLFADDDKKVPEEMRKETRNQRKERELEEDIERKMNRTSLITLWVDPAEHQIVKYTFHNVWLDFLPGAWLFRMDDISASMTMGQPFPGVWLPRTINIHAGITLANGSFEAGYERKFDEYRLAETSTRFKIKDPNPESRTPSPEPRAPSPEPRTPNPEPRVPSPEPRTPSPETPQRREHGPIELPEQPQEIVREIRIHGNAYLTDAEVLTLAGVAVDQPLTSIDAIEKKLKDSGRFESVDVRKRYRSLTDTTDIALVLVVHEKPGVRSITDNVNPVLAPFRRVRHRLMFLPIISFADGYGFTYGGRVSTLNALGLGERLSVPLTWGGTRRAALEFERIFKSGPLTRIDSSLAIWNRKNPRFEIRDQRVEWKGRAERVFADIVRVGVDASRSSIDFGTLDDSLWTIGTGAALDTRIDPAYPSNAVLLSTGVTRMNFRNTPDPILRYTTDARGYLRVYRQIVVAGRAAYLAADGTLPPYERFLLGGSSSVRGFKTGTFDGDRAFLTAAELRAPITSVLSGAKLGFNAFFDAGKIWDVGGRMEDAEWRRGVGGGVFLLAPFIRLNLDVARGLKTGDTRVHLSSGFTF